jgi:hypothetical protein
MRIGSPESVIQLGKKLYFIEDDNNRLRWITHRSLLTGELYGPDLTTAIEIDLDTLTYTEHILQV